MQYGKGWFQWSFWSAHPPILGWIKKKNEVTAQYSAYQTLGTGKLIARIENGAQAGKNILVDFYLCLFRQLLPTVLFSMYFIRKLNPQIMSVILAGYAFVFLVSNLLLKRLYGIKERILTREEELQHYLVRGFQEMVVFRMYRRFGDELLRARQAKREIVDQKVKMTLVHEAFFTIFALLMGAVKIGLIVYAWRTGSISIGTVVALMALVDNAYTPIAIFNVLYVSYKLDRSAFARLEAFLSCRMRRAWKTERLRSFLPESCGRRICIFGMGSRRF